MKTRAKTNQNGKSSIGRRDFLKKTLTAAGVAAAATVTGLEPGSGKHQDLTEDVVADFVNYPGETGEVIAYQAHPDAEGKFPGVIVIHENRGLVPHIRDVTRRMAQEGFLALAPDALSPSGGTPEDQDKARTLITELDRESTVKNFVAAVEYLKTNPLCTGKVGCTGFCWGGAMTNQVAVNSPDLLAAVPYYGSQPKTEDVPKIKAAMMLHYAGNDERINIGIPYYELAMKNAGIEFTTYIYEGAGHAFNNDSNPERYNREAAELAWKRTVGFFREKLK